MSKRGRELELPFPGTPGPYNAITDVPGVEVGYCTVTDAGKNAQTGVTAILPRGKSNPPSYVFAGLHALNGNGELTGSHWIEDAGYFLSPICITNTHSVGVAHHAVIKWMNKTFPDFFGSLYNFVMPVVAETYDGVLNDINGQHVKEHHVFQALNSASSGKIAEGNVGGGNGMISYEFKAGSGTSSRVVNIGETSYSLGVFVQSNFGERGDLTVCGIPVGELIKEDTVFDKTKVNELGSIIVVVATDAPLIPSQLRRVAKRASMGLARTGTISAHGSGDIFLAFSTANDAAAVVGDDRKIQVLGENNLDPIYRATRDATEEAIINSILAAETSFAFRPAGLKVSAIDHDELLRHMGI